MCLATVFLGETLTGESLFTFFVASGLFDWEDLKVLWGKTSGFMIGVPVPYFLAAYFWATFFSKLVFYWIRVDLFTGRLSSSLNEATEENFDLDGDDLFEDGFSTEDFWILVGVLFPSNLTGDFLPAFDFGAILAFSWFFTDLEFLTWENAGSAFFWVFKGWPFLDLAEPALTWLLVSGDWDCLFAGDGDYLAEGLLLRLVDLTPVSWDSKSIGTYWGIIPGGYI